ncbi:PLP-dependent aminotransferase family protein [uncultured Agrococcus sp.]|uniref:aminotransferase-like domain-containing protein n=1 Tax=uncultured Agrococcus sp. TaxID=382258 RepID=UPI0026014C02|nr:PLP-dependent aminotransferase family protein [uncultured Agrococcus sp.]
MRTSVSPRYNYAARAQHFRPSPVRGVFDISMKPGMISLAGGNPDLTVLPLEQLGDASARLIRDRGTEVLQYGTGAGVDELREALTDVMSLSGIRSDADDLLVTSGSQMGIELITTMLCEPDDVVLAESPTFVGAIGTFLGLEADVVHVDSDDEGLIPAALQESIRAVHATGKKIGFLYTIPSFSNPTGIRLSLERRRQIVEICRKEGVQIVEDDPYGIISFDGSVVPAMRSLDDSVVYLGTMSKIYSPGLRVGWMLAPRELRDRLQLASEATTICASVLSQHLALEFLTEFDWRASVETATGRYRARAAALVEGLEEHMPSDVRWTNPTGGFFTWLTLNRDINTESLLQRGIDDGIVFIPGTAFYADGQGTDTIRLAYSLASEQDLREGARRLAGVLS